jgi:hypothetical protein
LSEAVNLAIHRVPSSDVTLHIEHPLTRIEFRSRTGLSDEAIAKDCLGKRALLDALKAADLRAFVQNPDTLAFMRIPRQYWLGVAEAGWHIECLRDVDGATGWTPSMTGQPILVAQQDLPKWECMAEAITPEMIAAAATARKNAWQGLEECPGYLSPTEPQNWREAFSSILDAELAAHLAAGGAAGTFSPAKIKSYALKLNDDGWGERNESTLRDHRRRWSGQNGVPISSRKR